MKSELIFLIIIVNLCSGWVYLKHGDDWNSGSCTATHQSPINIEKYNLPDEPTCLNTKITFLDSTIKIQTLQTGHTLQTVDTTSDNSIKKFIQVDFMDGKKVKKTYKGWQFHLHSKSEHTVNGEYYDLELHIVTKNIVSTPLDLAVFGIFFTVTDNESEASPFFKQYKVPKDIEKAGAYSEQYELDFKQLFNLVFRNENKLFTYQGSLTTPDCNEVVSWHVIKNPLKISRETYNMFHELWFKASNDPEFKDGNNRSVQPLNGRTVYYKKFCYSEILTFALFIQIFIQLFIF